jgi:predicted nuclease of predicted toxin-antitoxin system|tara:strand:+ start:477 stop:818 length:342 start_codon:yes stop_codon:yes gene_type:complete
MQFLVDENLGSRFANLLKYAGYDAVFVGEVMRGEPDDEILSKGEGEKRVIITDDQDFGELIFKFKRSTNGVILFRVLTNNPQKRFEMIADILEKSEGKFIVVREGRIRVRRLK